MDLVRRSEELDVYIGGRRWGMPKKRGPAKFDRRSSIRVLSSVLGPQLANQAAHLDERPLGQSLQLLELCP